jgi:hypothetical protein
MTRIASAESAKVETKKSRGLLSVVETTRDFMRISKRQGGLVPQSVAGTVLGVSRQRVHQLVAEGTFSHWSFYGMNWLSQDEVLSFAKLQRQAGENQHKPSAKQVWKDSREFAKEFTKNRNAQGGS